MRRNRARSGMRLPRAAAICAAIAAAAIASITGGSWHTAAHADGNTPARNQAATAAPDETIREYTLRMLRALADDDTNNWVRYWRAQADCDASAYERRGDNPPIDRFMLALTASICAHLDALLGVNPAAHPPRGGERGVGLLLNEPGAAAGYTLFAVRDTRKAYLIDPLGRVAHTWNIKDNLLGRTIHHAALLNNGNLMIMANTPRALVEVDPLGNVVWQYDDRRLHHDFLKMPNGNMLLLSSARKTREQAIAAGANPEFVHENGVEYDYLIEVRPTGASGGEVVWEWSVWDHLIQDFDPSKPNYGAIAEHPELIDINFPMESRGIRRSGPISDWTHINSIDYNPTLDQIMLSPRHYSELWIIDHSATTAEARGHSGGNGGIGGDLLYRWGNPRAYGQGDADDQRLFWQHQTHWIPPGLPGAGNILVFNNGKEFIGYGRPYSSVEEIIPPANGYRYRRDEGAAYPPAKPAWTYAAEPPADFYSPLMSGAQRLPNGNTLIVDSLAGTIFQTTQDGKTAWKYIIPWHYRVSLWQDGRAPARLTHRSPLDLPIIKNEMYRASWYPPGYAGLRALDLTPGAYLEDTPDLLEWARAALIAGDFGERLADSDFDIYLDDAGDQNILIYYKQPCAAADARAEFFLHIIPADARDLPAARQEHGFANRDFFFGGKGRASDGWCLAIRMLPRYPIERIRTGQFTDAGEGEVWRAEIELGE